MLALIGHNIGITLILLLISVLIIIDYCNIAISDWYLYIQ